MVKLVEALHSLEHFNEGEEWKLKRYIHEVNHFVVRFFKGPQAKFWMSTMMSTKDKSSLYAWIMWMWFTFLRASQVCT